MGGRQNHTGGGKDIIVHVVGLVQTRVVVVAVIQSVPSTGCIGKTPHWKHKKNTLGARMTETKCFLFPSTWAAPHMQCIIWDRKGNCSSCPKRATSESRAAAGLFPTQSSVERDGPPALQIPPPSPLFHTSIDRWVDRSRSWFGVVWAEAGRSLLCGLLGSLASVSSAIDTPAPSRLR